MVDQRIGFCCKFVGSSSEQTENFNQKSTTIAWLNRQTESDKIKKLWEITRHNVWSLRSVLNYLATQPVRRRMMRIGSDFLPAYTHEAIKQYWQEPSLVKYISGELAKIGEFARQSGIRLSFHPGQFTCLASDNPDVINRSIEEFEYHTQLAQWMGYGNDWHTDGFKINVHLSGRGGAEEFRKTWSKLSSAAKNLITIENDEYSGSLDLVLSISDLVPIVFDIHHHFINSNGEFCAVTDPRITRVIDSWCGIRPVMHYSISPYVDGSPVDLLPDFDQLIKTNTKATLRKHSDMMWNRPLNELIIREYSPHFDVMVEAKSKNLASFEMGDLLLNYYDSK